VRAEQVKVTGWQGRALALARDIVYPQSRWWDAVTSVPRHVLVPRWFTRNGTGPWELQDGAADEQAWRAAAYDGWQTLITKVGAQHADHTRPGTTCQGPPTSSATQPSLAVAMYRHARIYDGADVLDVGTGSGYGCALLTRRLGSEHVTSIDIDPYLTSTAASRLDSIGLRPADIITGDAAAELPGSYDRIVPMVSLPGVPASWLAALRPGGRLVFSLTGGSVIITADKTPDGGAEGKVELSGASFMTARHAADDEPQPAVIPEDICDADGEDITQSRYPVVDPTRGWELDAMLSVVAPGITCRSDTDEQTGITTVWMACGDGSWARATGDAEQPATVHQAGPHRLWDILDSVRHRWLTRGALPLRGASVRIDPDGTCHLNQDDWHATIPGHPARSLTH